MVACCNMYWEYVNDELERMVGSFGISGHITAFFTLHTTLFCINLPMSSRSCQPRGMAQLS